ncbi:MAG: hypothetical protein Q9170_003976 [Blastenia crenularia]
MEWPSYEDYPQPVVLPSRPRRGRPSHQPHVYDYGPQSAPNPYAYSPADAFSPYTLPVYPTHVPHQHQSGHPRPQNGHHRSESNRIVRIHRGTAARGSSPGGDSFDAWRDPDTLTEVQSKSSDEASEDSFTFDPSPPETNDSNTDHLTDATNQILEPASLVDGSKPEKPSPYATTGLCVSLSRFIGDLPERWECTAALSSCQQALNGKQREQGLFNWMCVSQTILFNLVLMSSVISKTNTKALPPSG